jgi:predicted site-specific integrase-resolvase
MLAYDLFDRGQCVVRDLVRHVLSFFLRLMGMRKNARRTRKHQVYAQ